jgi:hypothetical protein
MLRLLSALWPSHLETEPQPQPERECAEDAAEWNYVKLLLRCGDTWGRAVHVTNDRLARKLVVAFTGAEIADTHATLARFGFPMFGTLTATEKAQLITYTIAFMEDPVCKVTRLHLAAACGSRDAVEAMVDAGAPIVQPYSVNTVMEVAARLGHVDVVEYLMDVGGDPGMYDVSYGVPPVVAVCDTIEEAQRTGCKSDLGRHWATLCLLASRSKGVELCATMNPKVIATAPLHIFRRSRSPRPSSSLPRLMT